MSFVLTDFVEKWSPNATRGQFAGDLQNAFSLEREETRKFERERCALHVELVLAQARAIMESIQDDKSWGFAMNEMTDEVNEKFRAASTLIETIPEKIRSGT